MSFEYDPDKSASNKIKHGIDFDEAQVLWDDPERVVVQAKNLVEPRYLVIGMINGKHWSAITTTRGENIRLISVRRSRLEEIKLYESDRI
jgi:uncharacterized protein